jgi:hypothetical protein
VSDLESLSPDAESMVSPLVCRYRIVGVIVLAALTLLWINSRILILRHNQDPGKATVPSAYYVYHGLAAALEEGRFGQLDLARYDAYNALGDPFAPYPPRNPPERARFVPYYSLDIGYGVVVEVARLAFPSLPDNFLRSLALQLLADAVLLVLVVRLFWSWHPVTGVVAGFLYVGNRAILHLTSVPLYYFWDVPLAFAVIGLAMLAWQRPDRAGRSLACAGAVLGFGVWLRGSWWPLTAVFFLCLLAVPATRRRVAGALLVFALVAAPQVARSSLARGRPALTTRAAWHVALVGLGYYPNAYGLQATDESVFARVRERYGVRAKTEDYGAHDEAAKQEFLSILRRDPAFVLRSFLGRFGESLLGATATSSPRPMPGVPNGLFRLLAACGLMVMLRQGGARRAVALLAFGLLLVYVLVTSLFYFVGFAYDNVPQVALITLILGLFDAARQRATEVTGRIATTTGRR